MVIIMENFESSQQPTFAEQLEEYLPTQADIMRKKSGTFRLRTLIISSVCCLLAGVLIALAVVPNALRNPLSKDVTDKLLLIDSFIDAYYIDADKADKQILADTAAWGYVAGLGDIYSTYYDAKSYADAIYSNSGGSYGIGISAVYYGGIYIVSVTNNSPAQMAGLKAKDVITAVDGQKVTEEKYPQLIDAIRGDKDTKVKLTVLRDGKESEIEVIRGEYTVESVRSRMIGTTGVIVITAFNKATPEQFKDALQWVQSKGAKALILDVRGNGGGLVNETNQVLDLLLPKCEIGYAIYKSGNKVVLGKSDKKCVDLPMCVLVDDQTASSAEYFASALRDSGKATLVGEKTFGKGIMQNTFSLGDGSAIKLTVAKIYTASGYEFHLNGLKPDIKVSYTEEQQKNWFLLTDSEDPYIQAALKKLEK